MTELEFDVLDELYFLTSFRELLKNSNLPQEKLKEVIKSLFSKGWVKLFISQDEELGPQDIDFENGLENYFYLASKSGLFAHNSKV